MDEQASFELEEWQERVDGLRVALSQALEERDNLRDAAASLSVELDKTKKQLNVALSTVDRLRLHIQQGIEL
jgi:predicted  nucleic acid-binding Zn-ribbon protein